MRRRIIVTCVVLALAACSNGSEQQPVTFESENQKMQEVVSFDGEPISFSADGLPVKVYKTEEQAAVDVGELLNESSRCAASRPAGYFDHLREEFTASEKTTYTVMYQGGEYDGSTYEISLIPNEPGYMTMDHFRQDFSGCGQTANSPFRMTQNWLVLASNCTGDDGCNQMRTAVEQAVEVK